MPAVIENILVMILTVVVLLGGGYLLLLILHWGLRVKSGRKEQEGLTDLWIAAQTQSKHPRTPEEKSEEHP